MDRYGVSDHRERLRQWRGNALCDATCYVAPPGGPSESRRRPDLSIATVAATNGSGDPPTAW